MSALLVLSTFSDAGPDLLGSETPKTGLHGDVAGSCLLGERNKTLKHLIDLDSLYSVSIDYVVIHYRKLPIAVCACSVRPLSLKS